MRPKLRGGGSGWLSGQRNMCQGQRKNMPKGEVVSKEKGDVLGSKIKPGHSCRMCQSKAEILQEIHVKKVIELNVNRLNDQLFCAFDDSFDYLNNGGLAKPPAQKLVMELKGV